ncbi:hypothetical protein GCM10023352_10360 [Rothia endophytica]|uniref:Uncharacterized protein n=1 Tax=Rothia endophytica TaxID=1324766 RepID=A0ABP9BEV2_9MICC
MSQILSYGPLTHSRCIDCNQETLAGTYNLRTSLPLGNGLDAVLDSCFGYKKVGARNYLEPDTNLLVI